MLPVPPFNLSGSGRDGSGGVCVNNDPNNPSTCSEFKKDICDLTTVCHWVPNLVPPPEPTSGVCWGVGPNDNNCRLFKDQSDCVGMTGCSWSPSGSVPQPPPFNPVNPLTYNCQDGSCITLNDGSGRYYQMSDCLADCYRPPSPHPPGITGYACRASGDYGVKTCMPTPGSTMTLEDCQASCRAPLVPPPTPHPPGITGYACRASGDYGVKTCLPTPGATMTLADCQAYPDCYRPPSPHPPGFKGYQCVASGDYGVKTCMPGGSMSLADCQASCRAPLVPPPEPTPPSPGPHNLGPGGIWHGYPSWWFSTWANSNFVPAHCNNKIYLHPGNEMYSATPTLNYGC